jgi:hypothetical protein
MESLIIADDDMDEVVIPRHMLQVKSERHCNRCTVIVDVTRSSMHKLFIQFYIVLFFKLTYIVMIILVIIT